MHVVGGWAPDPADPGFAALVQLAYTYSGPPLNIALWTEPEEAPKLQAALKMPGPAAKQSRSGEAVVQLKHDTPASGMPRVQTVFIITCHTLLCSVCLSYVGKLD